MDEDMTYEPVQTVAQLAARVQELERENAELRGTLNLIPEYLRYIVAWRARTRNCGRIGLTKTMCLLSRRKL